MMDDDRGRMDSHSLLSRRELLLGDENDMEVRKTQSRAVQDANSLLQKAQAATRPSCCGLWGKVDHEAAAELFLSAGSKFAAAYESDAAADAYQSAVDSFLLAGACRRALTALQHKAKALAQLSPLAAVGALRQVTDLCLDVLRDHSEAARASYRVSVIYEEQFTQSWQDQQRAARLGFHHEEHTELDHASLHLAIEACQLAAQCYNEDMQMRLHWVRTVARLGALHIWAEAYPHAIQALEQAIGEKVCGELACWSTPELMFNAGLCWLALDCAARFGMQTSTSTASSAHSWITKEEDDEKSATGGGNGGQQAAQKRLPEGSGDLAGSERAIAGYAQRFPTFAQEQSFQTLGRIRDILLESPAAVKPSAADSQPDAAVSAVSNALAAVSSSSSSSSSGGGNNFNSHMLSSPERLSIAKNNSSKSPVGSKLGGVETESPQVLQLLELMDGLQDSCGLKPEQEKVLRHIVEMVQAYAATTASHIVVAP